MPISFDEKTILELEDFRIPGSQRCSRETEKELLALRKEGKPLPKDYYETSNGFYHMPSDQDTAERVWLDLELKQLQYLRTIKRGVLFLVLLALLGLAVPLVMMIFSN